MEAMSAQLALPGPERDMGHSMRPVEQEQRERTRTGLRISDRRREKSKKPEGSPKKGARGGTWTHVGMSKGLHLVIEEKGGTSHQAALVIGGMEVINTGMGYGQWAPKHSKGMGPQRGE
jgi:hypothetical protein